MKYGIMVWFKDNIQSGTWIYRLGTTRKRAEARSFDTREEAEAHIRDRMNTDVLRKWEVRPLTNPKPKTNR